MKIKNIRDPKGFFETLKECKGTLEIVLTGIETGSYGADF